MSTTFKPSTITFSGIPSDLTATEALDKLVTQNPDRFRPSGAQGRDDGRLCAYVAHSRIKHFSGEETFFEGEVIQIRCPRRDDVLAWQTLLNSGLFSALASDRPLSSEDLLEKDHHRVRLATRPNVIRQAQAQAQDNVTAFRYHLRPTG